MNAPAFQRLEYCPACSRQAAGTWGRCIFCGHSLLLETVSEWRAVYHPYSYADAMLATGALRANGVTARLQQCNLERVLLGRQGGVVQVAADEHVVAREVLRRLRGVRTDTEYLEWQALKGRRTLRARLLIGALAAGTALAAGAMLALFSGGIEAEAASTQSAR